MKDWSLPRQFAGQDPLSQAAETPPRRPFGRGWNRLTPSAPASARSAPSVVLNCVYAKNGKPLHIEGDPRSPVNQGTLCPKGASTLGVLLSPQRINKVLHRAPFATQWEEKSLDWAMERIAQLTRQTRDDTFVEQLPDGRVVNHSLGIGSLGGATLDNEENYLIKKLFGGGLGLINIENQARI